MTSRDAVNNAGNSAAHGVVGITCWLRRDPSAHTLEREQQRTAPFPEPDVGSSAPCQALLSIRLQSDRSFRPVLLKLVYHVYHVLVPCQHWPAPGEGALAEQQHLTPFDPSLGPLQHGRGSSAASTAWPFGVKGRLFHFDKTIPFLRV